MTSLKDIFSSSENRPKTRSRSKTRPVPPFATFEHTPKPQWNRNIPQKPMIRSAIVSQTKKVEKPKAIAHAHAPDGAEFHQRRSKFVQCRNQSSQTDLDKEIESTTDNEVQKLASLVITDTPKKIEQEKKTTSRVTVRSKKSNKPVKPVEIDPNCPPGHVALSEPERLEMLSHLQKLYAEALAEMNRLPICVDTLRVRTRRFELEKQLQDTEGRIKLISKPKVYVPIDLSD